MPACSKHTSACCRVHRSTHIDSIYTVDCCEADIMPTKRSCRIEDFDRLADIAEQYSQL
jgi:hypothetical protein